MEIEGYSYQGFPNLAESREVQSKRLIAQIDLPTSTPSSIVRAALSRLLFSYADAEDLLLEAQSEEGVKLVRVSLDKNSSRNQVAESLSQQLQQSNILSESDLQQINEKLGIASHQSPAILSFSTEPTSKHQDQDWYPKESVALVILPANRLQLVSDESILSSSTASLFLKQLISVISLLKDSPEGPFAELLPTTFDSSLLSIHSRPFDSSKATLSLEWLYKNAMERPQAIAHELYSSTTEKPYLMTYSELDKKSNQLARWIRSKVDSFQIETSIAVCRNRDAHFYIAHAAIWKAGGCYVPIDTDLPPERKSFISKDSNAKIILCHQSQKDLFGEGLAVVLESKEVQKEVEKMEDGRLEEDYANLDSLAYLLYTSGTTGTPKGCLQLHRGVYWAIEAMVEMPKPITNPDTDKRLAMAAVAFDVHISEMAQSWALGTRLVSVESRLELLADLQENIINFGITHIGMVPSMMEATLTKPAEELPLKYMVSGGEKVSDAVLKKWAVREDIVFANFYGPTEATIGCTSRRVKVSDRKENIGLSFPSCSSFVAKEKDGKLEICPRGTPGELIVEGALVGRGYLGREDATKKTFVEWPEKGDRSYRTGDLVRMFPDGTIIIAGRIDSQIKLRGVRIESEGVSNVIRKASTELDLDAVSVVTKHPKVGSSELLVTFVAPGDGRFSVSQRREAPIFQKLEGDLSSVLREASNKELASYMRPSHIIPVNFLPLSHNGKVDLKSLVSLFQSTSVSELLSLQGLGGSSQSESKQEDRKATETEQVIMEEISSISGTPIESLKPSSRLLESGLSSLQIAALTARLRSKIGDGRALTVAQVIGSETVEGCSQLFTGTTNASSKSILDLEAFDRDNRIHAEDIFDKNEIESVLPQFPVQPGVLFQTTQQPQGYVQHFLYKCRPGLTASEIEKAWSKAMQAHEILRAVFVIDGASQPLQVILKSSAIQLPIQVQTISEQDVKEDSDFVTLFSQKYSQTTSSSINEDLTTPMWKVCIFNLANSSEECLRMSLSLNHSIYDAFAVRALMLDLDSILSQSDRTNSSLTLGKVLQEIGDTQSSHHRKFWTEHLKDVKPALEGRISRTPKSKESTRTVKQFSISFADVRSFCSEVGITTQSFFNAAFALAGRDLFHWDSGFALFGGVRSGRDLALEGIDRAVCPLVSLVPTRVDLSGHDASEFLKNSQRSLLDSSSYDRVPLGQIQRWLGFSSLIEVLFSCRIEGARASYQKFQHIEGTPPSPEFILAIEMLLDESADSIEARAAFTSSDLKAEEVEALLGNLERITRSLIEKDTSALKLSSPSTSSRPTSNSTPTKEESQSNKATEAEITKVMDVVSSFLGLDADSLSPTSSLVSFGLTSLRSVGLSRALGNEGITVSPSDVIQSDSCKAIAEVATSSGQNGDDQSQEIDVAKIETEAAKELDLQSLRLSESDQVELAVCTPLQAGMLSQTISTPGSLYVHAFTLQLQDDVDIEKVKGAWRKVIEMFNILRSSFHFDSLTGRWVQVAHSVDASPLRWEQVEALESEDFMSLSKRLVQKLDLTSEQAFSTPPLYLHHVKREDLDSVVVILHHALYDGVSLSNLFDIVTSLYHKQPIPSSPQFSDIARDIVKREQSSTAYWKSRMSNCSVSHLPSRDSSNSSSKAWRATREVGLRNVEDLHRVARRYQVTAQCFGQLALARLLAEKSALADVTFCQVVSGRTLQGAGEVIGPVFNTILCRVQLSKKTTSREALRKLHQDNLKSLSFQHAPLRSIQQELGVRSLGDALFVFQPRVKEEKTSEPIWKLAERPSEVDQSTTHFTLNVELHESDNAFEARASCAADVFSRQQLDEILDVYVKAISDIVYQPNQPLLPPGLKLAEPRVQRKEPAEKLAPKQNGSSETFSEQDDQVLDILAGVLNVDKNIFHSSSSLASLGLDSIAAIQIASRSRRAGFKLAPTDVVRASTIGDLLETIRGGSQVKTNGKQPNGDTHTRDLSEALLSGAIAETALSHLRDDVRQDAKVYRSLPGLDYLFAGWQRAGGRAFHLVFARQASERLDVDRLKEAWTSLIKRHSVLRSIVVPTGDSESRLAVCVVDADHYDPSFFEEFSREDEESHIKERAMESLRKPNVAEIPSPRMVLVHGIKHDYVLIDMLHVHYDGWSMKFLLSDLEAFYEGREPTSANNFEELLLEAGSPSTRALSEQKSYWKKYLGSSFSPSLWNSSSRPAPTNTMQHFHVELRDSTPKMLDLQATAKRLGVSVSSVIISTWAQVQSERSSNSSSSATFGLVQNGRSVAVEDIETMAAPSVNLVPLHVEVESASSSRSDSAKKVQEMLLERPNEIEQSRISDIAAWTGVSKQPLINVSLNLLFLPAADKKEDERGEFGENGSKSKPKSFWQPYKVPESLPIEEQAKPVSELFNQNGLTFPEIQLDLRLVVASSAASSPAESRLVFLAEGALQRVEEEEVVDSLKRWCQILEELIATK